MKAMKKFFKILGILIGALLLITIIIGILVTGGKQYENPSKKYSLANLNIRTGPGSGFQIKETINPNDTVITFDSINHGYIMILDKNNKEYGWASTKYLQSEPLSKKQLDSIKYKDDPLRLGKDRVKDLIGNKFPYNKRSKWGYPETLSKTNNRYWVGYFPKANVSFVSIKSTDEIIYSGLGKNKAISYMKRKEQKREKEIQSQFSEWDGSHDKLERVIRKSMNDPDSYEHVKTVYWDTQQDYIIVKTTFRGKNAFGGTVTNWVKAKVDIESGDVLEITEQGP